MFIRQKKVKNSHYAYVVRNRWTRKGPRQKVSKYLGKVYKPELIDDEDFLSYMEMDYSEDIDDYLSGKKPSEVIVDLVSWVLLCHGFRQSGRVWKKDAVVVDIKKKKVFELPDVADADGIKLTGGRKKKNKPRPIAINVNSDFLCSLTLRQLLGFKSSADKGEVAVGFAKAFIRAGIPVPEAVFVGLFQKIWKHGQSYVF